MDSGAARSGRRARRGWQAGVLAAAIASVAGCVSMPDSGPVAAVSVGPTSTGQNPDYIGSFPAGPQRGWSPEDIVTGFLLASANPSDRAVARQYLTPQAAATWAPGQNVTVLDDVQRSQLPLAPAARQGQVVTVRVAGTLHATLNSSGQYITATATQQSGGCGKFGDNCDDFHLIYTGGQWRIQDPPKFLLLYTQDFETVYTPHYLYWFTPDNEKLVPDSVYVPLSAAPQDVLTRLVNTLIRGPDQQDWLGQGATVTSFPKGTTVLGVTPENNTAIVDLGGTAITTAGAPVLGLVSAQLAYTLAGLPGGQDTIDGIELEINGTVWDNGLQKYTDPDFNQYAPYPGGAASFTYVGASDTAMVSCGSILDAAVGPPLPVIRTPGLARVPVCAQAAASAPASPGQQSPGQTSSSPRKGQNPGRTTKPATLSQVAISPDGKLLAEVHAVGPDKDVVSIGPAIGRWPSATKIVSAQVTAICWDRQGDLWVASGDGVEMISPSGAAVSVDGFPGTVTALSIAPDGVRVAAIVQSDSGNELVLAAITRGEKNSQQQPGPRSFQASTQVSIGTAAPLGPGVSDPVALTWYDVTDLLVVDQAGLEDVPVGGGPATPISQPSLPAGQTVTTITAQGGANVIVAGTSSGQLEVSDGADGPWQVPAAAAGTAPLYGGG